MTPTHVPEQFDRTMGCTAAELISWLPRSLPDAQLADVVLSLITGFLC